MTHPVLLRRLVSRVKIGVTAVKHMQFSSPSDSANAIYLHAQ
jgi:hypothetical protein